MRSAWTCAIAGVLGLGTGLPAQQAPRGSIVVRGTVIDTALRPVAGVLVSLAVARVFTVTDRDGGFELADLAAGTDTLHIRGRGLAPRSFRVAWPDSLSDTIDVGTAVLGPGAPPLLTLTVTVRDTLPAGPVADAEVVVNERSVGVTDADGALSVSAIPVEWGINSVLVRRIGYAPLVGTLWVDELEADWVVEGIMPRQAVELPAVVIEGDRIVFAYGRMRDFWRRREQGWGRYITRFDVEQRRPVFLSDLLITIPGVWVERTPDRTRVVSTRGRRCELAVWIDGAPSLEGVDVDRFVRPGEIDGIEVYADPAVTPTEFSAPGAGCGTMVIWTR